MMCEACTEGRHHACGRQTWCECECDPDNPWSYQSDPSDDPANLEPILDEHGSPTGYHKDASGEVFTLADEWDD